ncbi:MAG TPA: acyl-CoA desaturase [Ktedonobacterales bacterium]
MQEAQLTLRGSARRSSPNEYVQLKQLMKQGGFLSPQSAYYIWKFLSTLGMLGVGIAFLFIIHNFWLLLLDALYMGFVSMQFGLLGHDIGHRQVFRTSRNSRIAGFLVGNLMVGWSWSWWIDKHNAHHGHPNQVGLDPDIRPFTALTEDAARNMRGIARFLAKYQAYLTFPLFLLSAIAFLIMSVLFLYRKKAPHVRTEALLLTLHYGLYLGLLLWRLDVWQVLPFVLVHHACFGMYLGSIGAPNHKGMPIMDADSPTDFLRQQVLTARNVKGSPLVDFWYGGLNYQIEHHLFPTMPRNKLRQARPLIKAFCEEHGIDYCETTLLQSYLDILRFLQRASMPLREEKA